MSVRPKQPQFGPWFNIDDARYIIDGDFHNELNVDTV
jgi:hypothetical protein